MRYCKLAKEARTAREFVEALFGPDFDWAEAWAAARIYMEDGGRKFRPEEFYALAQPPSEVGQGDFERFLRSPM